LGMDSKLILAAVRGMLDGTSGGVRQPCMTEATFRFAELLSAVRRMEKALRSCHLIAAE
jgi:hypothetical protein